MTKIASVKRDTPHVRALERADVEKILAVIPAKQIREQLLFHMIFETGLRVGEARQLYLVCFSKINNLKHSFHSGDNQRIVLGE